MSFDIKIKVDPGNSVQTIKTVETELAKTERVEKAVTNQTTKLGGSFADLGMSARGAIDAMGKLNHALDFAKKTLNFAEGAWKAYGNHLRLETAAGAANIDKLASAASGLQTNHELLTFAARAQHGELSKLNLTHEESQRVMERVLQAETALIRAGFEQDEVTRKLLDSTIKLRDEGLDDLGLSFKQGATQAETLQNMMKELDRVIEANKSTTSDNADEVQRLGVMWRNAKDALEQYVGASLSKGGLKSGKGLVFDTANVLSFGQAGRNLEDRLTREANESVKLLDAAIADITKSVDGAAEAYDAWEVSTSFVHDLALERTLDKWTSSLEKHTEATRKAKKEQLDLLAVIRASVDARDAAEASRRNMDQDERDARFFAGGFDLAGQEEGERAQLKRINDAAKDEQKVANDLTKSWHDRLEQAERDNERFANSFAPVGEAMRRAFWKAS